MYNDHQKRDQLKACSEILSCTLNRRSSLVFPDLTLVRAILLQTVNNCRSFQIQLSISHFHPAQALSSLFRNFHWNTTRYH